MSINVYPKYGKIFQILRKQRGYKLTSFSHIDLSPSAICKFENGKTMLRLDKLVLALNEMSIKLSDYENFFNNFQTTINEPLIQQTIIAWMSGDYSKLQKWHDEAIQYKENICALAIKSISHSLTSAELEYLYDYFDNLQLWRNIDLYSLYLTIEYFNSRQVSYLIEGFFINISQKNMTKSIENKIEFIHIICKAVLILSFKGIEQLSAHFLNYINPATFPHTMYTKNLYDFAKGYWISTFKDSSKGAEKMEQSIFRFSLLCNSNIAKYCQYVRERYTI